MPIRSRSHELEELSVARFNDLLPAKWVSRPKIPDYGIDREVELYDAQGLSTGLSFLVQLRATDDRDRADKVVLETDELDYYRQLDLPVIVARYCSVTNAFHWQWESLIRFRSKLADGQKSTTYRFGESERWTDETPASIQRTLEVRRALANFPQGAAMPIRLDLSALSAADRYPVERAIGEAIAQCAGALMRPREQRPVEVEVAPDPDGLTVRIDTITSMKIDLPNADPESFATSLLYALIKLFSHKGLFRQAETIARGALARGTPHHEMLGLAACQALAGDPVAMVELAILHGFHRQTAEYGAITFEITRSPAGEAARATAINRFFEAALDAAKEAGPASVAAIHYSIANYFRGPGRYLRSLRHYNRARRLRPAYLQADYFLRELGGLLFEAGRFACAADAYSAAQARSDDPFLCLLLGDALLFTGAIAQAETQFAAAAERHPPGIVVQEAELKRLTCAWLREETGRDTLAIWRRAADAAMRPDASDDMEALRRVIGDLDALNPRAHFNLGILLRDADNFRDAIPHFLACAFVQRGDTEAWANAAICAFAQGESELLIGILAVAIENAGAGAYDRMRIDLVALGVSPEALEGIDTVAVTLLAEAQSSDPNGFTLRLLDGDGYETMTIIDP